MKKKINWTDIIFKGIELGLIISVLLLMWINNTKVQGTIIYDKINTEVVTNEDKHYNIYTTEDLSKLYSYKQDIIQIDESIVELTYDEAQLLMKLARAEGGDTLMGQLWVMRIVINRLEAETFGNSIYDVIYQEGQFEVVSNGTIDTVELNSNSHIALAMLEGGWDETDGALYFEAISNSNESWHAKNLDFITTIKGQRYYR